MQQQQANDIKVDPKLLEIAQAYAICSINDNIPQYAQLINQHQITNDTKVDAIIFCSSPDFNTYQQEVQQQLELIKQQKKIPVFESDNFAQYIKDHQTAINSGCKNMLSVLDVHGNNNDPGYVTCNSNKQDMQYIPAVDLFHAINAHMKPQVRLTFFNTSCRGDDIIKPIPQNQRLKADITVTFAEHGEPVNVYHSAKCLSALFGTVISHDGKVASCIFGALISKNYFIGATIFGRSIDQKIQVDQNTYVITNQDVLWLEKLMQEGLLPQSAEPSIKFIKYKIKESNNGQIRMLHTALKELYNKNNIAAHSTYTLGYEFLELPLLQAQRSMIDETIINYMYIRNLYSLISRVYDGNFGDLYDLSTKKYGLNAFYSKKIIDHILQDHNMFDKDRALFMQFFPFDLSEKMLSTIQASLMIKELMINNLYHIPLHPNLIKRAVDELIVQGAFNKSIKKQLSKLCMHHLNQIIEEGANLSRVELLKALLINNKIVLTPNFKSCHGAQIYIPDSALNSLIDKSMQKLNHILQHGILQNAQKYQNTYLLFFDILLANKEKMQVSLNKFIHQLANAANKERFLNSRYVIDVLKSRSKDLAQNPELLYAFCSQYKASPQESKLYGLDNLILEATNNIAQTIIMSPQALDYEKLELLNDLLKLNPTLTTQIAQQHGVDICNAILNAHGINPNKPITKINIPNEILIKLELAYAICPNRQQDPRLKIVQALIEAKSIDAIDIIAQNNQNQNMNLPNVKQFIQQQKQI